MGQDGIGLSDDVVIVVPGIEVILAVLAQVEGLVVDGRPAGRIGVVVVILAWIVLIQTDDSIFAAVSLGTHVLLGAHGQGDSVQGSDGALVAVHSRGGTYGIGRGRIQIILGAGSEDTCTDQDGGKGFVYIFHTLSLF